MDQTACLDAQSSALFADRRSRLTALLIGCAGVAWVFWANDSPRLPGVSPDSVQYIAAARSIAELRGPQIPVVPWSSFRETSTLAHYPPGFSAVVALLLSLGLAPSGAATVVMALGAGATLLLAYELGRTLSGTAGGVFSAALVAFYPEWMRLHTAVWSEPLFLALFLAALLAMVRAPARSALHGLLAAACVAVRYVGLSVTVLAVLVAWRTGSPGRTRRIALAGLPSVFFLGGWVLYVSVTGPEKVRTLALNPGWLGWLGSLPGILARWAAPVGGIGLGIVALLGVGGLLARGPIWSAPTASRFRSAAIWGALSYLAILAAARAFADPAIPMDARMLLPVISLVAIAAGAALGEVVTRGGAAAALAAVLPIAWSTAGATVAQHGIATAKQSGQFFTHEFWERSDPLRWARQAAPAATTLYSNEPELIHLYTGRPAHRAAVDGDDLERWREAWHQHPGPLIMMNPPRAGDLPPDVLLEGLDVKLVTAAPEGAVFWR